MRIMILFLDAMGEVQVCWTKMPIYTVLYFDRWWRLDNGLIMVIID
jgi:hypothetical protein